MTENFNSILSFGKIITSKVFSEFEHVERVITIVNKILDGNRVLKTRKTNRLRRLKSSRKRKIRKSFISTARAQPKIQLCVIPLTLNKPKKRKMSKA